MNRIYTCFRTQQYYYKVTEREKSRNYDETNEIASIYKHKMLNIKVKKQ